MSNLFFTQMHRVMAESEARMPRVTPSAVVGPGLYRVEVDWDGGGIGATRHFDSAADAQTWGEFRARHHKHAIVMVTPREPARTFRDIHEQAQSEARAIVRGAAA